MLLSATDAGEPASAHLQELAERKLPEVQELIEQAEIVRRWLETARGCGCESLDVCGLFSERDSLPAEGLHLVVTDAG